MNIPEATLSVLKCKRCASYLSRSPVYVQCNNQNDWEGICDLCLIPNRPAYRYIEYEAVAQLLRFPCKYQHHGCPEYVPFVNRTEEIAHETNCNFNRDLDSYMCPILDPDQCTERVTEDSILQHCLNNHPSKEAHSPIKFQHDMSISNRQAFLIQFNEELFVCHAKICLETGKMYHSVLFLGNPEDSQSYYFNLAIINKFRIQYEHDIAPKGNLVYEEARALVLDINNVYTKLDNCAWNDVYFKIVVKKRGTSTGFNRTQSVRLPSQKKMNQLSRTSSLRISNNMTPDFQRSGQRKSTAVFTRSSSSQHCTQDFPNVTALRRKWNREGMDST